jgi:hypothetical protein
LNTPAYTSGTKCLHCGATGVKLVRAKEYYELCEKCKKAEDEGIIKSGHGHGKAIGALVAIIIIAIIIAVIANYIYQTGRQTDKLLVLGCTPEAWGSMGVPTIWSCPAWRNIDVNDPKTFMDQSPISCLEKGKHEVY